MAPVSADQPLCAHCRTWRDRSELVEVERLATGVRRFVCRHSMDGHCFRDGIGPASADRIVPNAERVTS